MPTVKIRHKKETIKASYVLVFIVLYCSVFKVFKRKKAPVKGHCIVQVLWLRPNIFFERDIMRIKLFVHFTA